MNRGREIVKNFCSQLPNKPGIYKFIGENGKILYIGKAKDLKKRVSYYYKDDLPTRLQRMVFEVEIAEYILTNSEAEAFLLEASQIRANKPKYNILLKDDKSFPFIKVTSDDEYPVVMKYRGKKLRDEKLYGPFASIGDVERTISILKKIFKLRTCSDTYFSNRKRPCLQYQIKKCSAPCVGKISKEEYRESVNLAILFLSGKSSTLQKTLSEKMEEYSENMNFEKAAEIRDNIKALSYVQVRSGVVSSDMKDADVIICVSKSGFLCIEVFFYRSSQFYGSVPYFPKIIDAEEDSEILSSFIGQFYQTRTPPARIITNLKLEDKDSIEQGLFELYNIKTKIISSSQKNDEVLSHAILNANESLSKKITQSSKNLEVLERIKDIFNLEDVPTRIEAYDNSHIMGKYAVGAFVVAGLDGFEKSEYRKYTIQSNTNEFGGDDYAMLKEVLTRRIKRMELEQERIPSLILIDGGKGHLSAATEVFKKFNCNVPFACMSKGEKRNAGFENFHMNGRDSFTLDNNDNVMKYLQLLRDEVHDYVINSHRNKRKIALKTSQIDLIPFVGEKRKKQLLSHFGSFDAIKSASISELSRVEGISENIAKEIYSYFRR